jgi:hypothetical protein
MPFKLVSGGEDVTYCYESPTVQANIISKMKAQFAPFQQQYPNLYIGATISPWADASQLKGWMLQDRCGRDQGLSMNQRAAMMHSLFTSVPYVYVYAASAAGYNPYDPQTANTMNQFIKEAIEYPRAN